MNTSVPGNSASTRLVGAPQFSVGQPNCRHRLLARRHWALAVLVALVAFTLARLEAAEPNFNPDESRWLSRAHYLAQLGDPLGANWIDRYMTRGQPPLGSYVMGLGLVAQGRDLVTNPPWDFSRPWEVNVALGRKPVVDDLQAGRRTSAVLVALTCLAIIAIARLFVPPVWAIGAGALHAVHPFTSYLGAIAMADALFGFLIAAAAAVAAALAMRPGWPRAMLLGAILGLGGATKLSPLLLAPALTAVAFAVLAISWARKRRLPVREARFAALGIVILVTAAATFVASYPYLWPDPLRRGEHLFRFRVAEMATQASDWPEMAVPTRLEALRRAGITFSERFTLSGSVAQQLTDDPAPRIVRQLEIVVPLIGLVLMGATAARAGPFAAPSLALAVLAGQCAITLLGMRSEFDRYHLPLALLGAVAAVVAVERLFAMGSRLRAHWGRRTAGRASAARRVAVRNAARRFPGESRI